MNAYASHIVSYLLAQSWQIALTGVIVGLASWALRNRSAHPRYLLWLIVLAKCLVPPVLTVPVAVLPHRHPASVIPSAAVPEESTGAEMPMLIERAAAADQVRSAGPTAREGIALAWAAGVLLFLVWVGGRAVRYTCWLQGRRRPLSPALQQSIRELSRDFAFKRQPRVWLLADIGQPFVWGVLRGSVYLPAEFADLPRSDQRRSVLAHELSHVARFDAGVNTLQVAAQALYWFHPFVWWANRKIRQEREKCCDEMAVARLSTPPERYTGAIVDALASERRSGHPIPSLAVVGSVKDIEERIKTMLKPGRTFRTRPTLAAATVALLIALVTIPTALVLTARGQTPPTPASQADAGPAGPEQRYPARTFNSTLPFDVFVQETIGAEMSPGLIGHTPSPTPLEIRPNVIWWVKPTAPVTDWKALLQEIEQSEIPGLMLVSVEDSETQPLADFKSLKGLWLEGETLTDAGLVPLEGLTGLQVLRLHKARIMGTGLVHIEGMTGLEVLRLDLTTDESLSHVKGLTQLQSLAVGFPVTDAGMVYLKGLTELRRLGLYGTRVTDAGLVNLKGLSKLGVLNLSFTRITDAGMTDLAALSSLSRLFVDHTAVTDAGLARLQTKTRLRRLNLNDNKITDTGLANLEPQNELNWLDLSGTQITDDGLVHLKGMSGILRLHLSRTQITGTGLEHVKGLVELWQLGLSETRMTDAGLAHLTGMTQLRDLNLSGTQITDAGLVHIQDLTGLQKLDLSGTRVTDAGVQQLKQSLPNVNIVSQVLPASQAAAIVGSVFTDNFGDGPSTQWRFVDRKNEGGPAAGHTAENGQLMLSNAKAGLDSVDWTDYIARVHVCVKESVASGDAIFGIEARTTPTNSGLTTTDCYTLAILCQDNEPRGVVLGLDYYDASKTNRKDMMGVTGCAMARDQWYTLEFEVRGQHLRGYLDGKLMVDVTDARLSKGPVWLTAWRTRVLVDDFSVSRLP